MGFQLNMPLGFRREMAGVRNAQLQLAKERAKLQEGELELSHQLAFAVRDLEANYVLEPDRLQPPHRRPTRGRGRDRGLRNRHLTIDGVLEAQQTLAQAESDYYRALVDYNKSIPQVHFRKGSLLEYNGVYLAEGPWPGKAYFDARRRARARDASTYLDYGFTQPKVISRGPIEQHAGGGALMAAAERTPAAADADARRRSPRTAGTGADARARAGAAAAPTPRRAGGQPSAGGRAAGVGVRQPAAERRQAVGTPSQGDVQRSPAADEIGRQAGHRRRLDGRGKGRQP